MVWVCHYLGALIFGVGVIVCIVCYGSVWLPCLPMLSWDALSTCPLHIMHIVSVPGVGGAMYLLVAPTYIVSVSTTGNTVLPC